MIVITNGTKYTAGGFTAWADYEGPSNLVDGVDYSSTITLDPTTFPNGVEFNWSFPSPSVPNFVYAYPDIKYGDGAPGGPAATQVADFTALNANYSVAISGDTSDFSVAFDLYLTSAPGNDSTTTDELMVQVHNHGAQQAGNQPYTLSGGGLSNATISVNPNWDAGGTWIPAGWTFINIQNSVDALTGTLNLGNIIKDLIWDGVLTGQEYINDIQLGSEIIGGSGSLTVNNLSYQWDANPTVTLAAGDNTYSVATPGGNNIVGNGGTDTVIYQGAYSQYQIEQSGTETLVQRSGNISTLDVLNGIAFVQFSDGIYDVATSTFISDAEINNIYLAVLQRNATQSEINTWVTADASIGIAAVIADIINLPETQQYVYPVIQIIELATGLAPTAGQVDGWVNAVRAYVAQGETINQALLNVAQAWVNNSNFQAQFGTTSTSVIEGIYGKAFGIVPTTAQVAAWSVVTPAEILLAFAVSTPYSDKLQASIQQYLTAAANGTVSAPTLAVDDNGVGAETSTAAVDVAAADVTALGGVAHNDTGVAVAYLDAPGTPAANGLTTTFNGLAASGELFIGDTFGTAYMGNIVVNQGGTVGSDILTIALGDAVNADVGTIQSLTVSDDASLIIYNGYGGDNVIASLVDATNSVQTILIADGAGGGGGELTIGSISDVALKTIDAHLFSGDLTLTANQAVLTIVGSTGGFELTAGGTGDTILDGTDSAPANTVDGIFIQAGGAGDHISVIGGIDPEIGAPGAGAAITVAAFSGTAYLQGNENGHINDTSSPAISLGAGDTISVGDAAHPGGDAQMWVGANSTINLTAGAFADVHLLGDTAGASLTNLTTINGVSVGGADVRLHFNDTNTAITTEAWAGGTSENSLVNVSGAASLAAALNFAASQAAVEDQQFDTGTNTTVLNQNTTAAMLQLNAHTGLVDWFQFGGNTFVVEAVNSTATTTTHAALGENDIVVELTGIVDVSHISVANV